jgi:hypothetical protein
MLHRIALSVGMISLCLSRAAIADLGPNFNLAYAAWEATDVVVVDSKGVILEVWKGDLEPRSAIPIESFKTTVAPEVTYDGFDSDGKVPTQDRVKRVTGDRRAFFLKRGDKLGAWKPVSSWNESTIWIEQAEVFALQQGSDMGRSLIRPFWTEEKTKNEAERIVGVQKAIRTAAMDSDPTARAKRMTAFLGEENYLALNETLEILKSCGSQVWPVIRPLIDDEEKLPIHSRLIHVAGAAAIDDARPTIESIIESELKYWDSLSNDEQRAGSYSPPMHFHYYKLSACLFVLKRSEYRDSKGLVAKLRSKWSTVPNLRHLGGAGSTGRSPILTYADEILQNK